MFGFSFNPVKMFRSAMEQTFLLLFDDFDELESLLNQNGIEYGQDEEPV